MAYHGARLGTIGLELLEQLPGLTTVVVPIGGGGLISGIAVAPAASALASRRAGRTVAIESAETIADGIAVKRLGDLTFPLIERYVDDIVAVDEAQIAGAVHRLLERQKLLAEGAGAVALATIPARLSASRRPFRQSRELRSNGDPKPPASELRPTTQPLTKTTDRTISA